MLRGSSKSCISLFSTTGHADDLAVANVVLADCMVLGVGDENVSFQVDTEVLRPVERRFPAVAAVTSVAGFASANQRSNLAGGIHHPQRVAAPLEYVDAAF